MITKGTDFIPVFTGGNGNTHFEPVVGFMNDKIVYSRYVIFGTTYNTQDFTFNYSVNQGGQLVPHTWQVEVLGKAGTDSDKGDYYYCGLLNDTQDVTTYQSPTGILEQFTAIQYQTCKVRDILWVIPFGDLGAFNVIRIYMKNNSYANSCDFTYIVPFANIANRNLSAMFSNAPITEVKKLGDFLQALSAGSIALDGIFTNNKLTTLDFRPFTRWYDVTNLSNVVGSSSTLESIYFSESDADNSNYINIGFNNLTKITSLDLAKIKCKNVSTLNLSGNSLLTTITGLSNIRIKTNASQGRILNGDLALVSDPDISSWTDEDGVSKPTITVDSATTLWQNCGKSVPANSRTWEIDTRGWSFQLSSLAYQDKSNAVGFSIGNNLGNSDGYGVKIAGIHFLPYSTNTWVILGISFGVNRFSDTTLDIDAMVGASYELIISKNVLYEAFNNNTNLTTVKFGRAKVIDYGGEIQSYVLTRTFNGATNLSSIDLRVQHFNVYRNMWNAQRQQYETSLAPFNIGLATAWNNTTQINDLIDDLVATQSEQYRVNGIKFEIQFNAAQRDIIQARPNWSTDIVTISNNGWEIIFPVSINNEWQSINMSELE